MRTRFFALYVATFVYTAFAQERAAPLRNDLKRPVQEISADLHVSSEQFVACFAGVTPAAGGGRPGREKVHSNKSVLLNCLQSANFSLTNDQLDAVMDRYRPGGRAAQAPRLRDSAAGSPLKTSSAFTRLT